MLFGETIKTALLAIVSNKDIEHIEELGVALADGNTPRFNLLERNENGFRRLRVLLPVAVNGKLILDEAVGLAGSHFHHTRTFIRQRRHGGIFQIVLRVKITG